MPTKTYKLKMPIWRAVIPSDWTLEIASGDSGFRPVAGTEIAIAAGDRLRGGPDTLIAGMLAQGFIEEEATDADSI